MIPLIDAIGGEPAVRALVERFYDIVETAPEGAPLLALHHGGRGLAELRVRQFDFLCGFLGGRRRYAEAHGRMDLRALHAHLSIRPEEAAAWLACMGRALDETGVAGPARARIDAAFDRAAAVLVAASHPRTEPSP